MDEQLATDQTIIALAERDFDFAVALRHVGEKAPMDAALLGAFISERFDGQTIRRIYVRLFMSLVESVIATLKAELLTSIPSLTPAQQALLAEKTYELTEKGKPKERPYFAQAEKNVRFALDLYSEANKLGVLIDYTGRGWQAFLETIRIRNRITHPKAVGEMVISDKEMKSVDEANDWFGAAYRSLMATHTSKLEAELEELRRQHGH